jgi:hypothetical protein
VRVGLSWDADRSRKLPRLGGDAEAQAPTGLELDPRGLEVTDCSAPSIFLTYLSQTAKSCGSAPAA